MTTIQNTSLVTTEDETRFMFRFKILWAAIKNLFKGSNMLLVKNIKISINNFQSNLTYNAKENGGDWKLYSVAIDHKRRLTKYYENGILAKPRDLPNDEEEVKPKLRELTDVELAEIIKDRVEIVNDQKDLKSIPGTLQLTGRLLVVSNDVAGNRSCYQLKAPKKKEVTNNLSIVCTHGTCDFNTKSDTFPYQEFMKWFYCTEKPYFEFSHRNGFKTFLRSEIKHISFTKVKGE